MIRVRLPRLLTSGAFAGEPLLKSSSRNRCWLLIQGEQEKMRLFKSSLVALTALFVAGSASALVTVNLSSPQNNTTIAPGSQVQVDVKVVWDGAGALQGIFSSTAFDPSVLSFVSACRNTASPCTAANGGAVASVLGAVDLTDPSNPVVFPGLGRLGGNGSDLRTLAAQPGDPASIIRTVQYGGLNPLDPFQATAAGGSLVTRLLFTASNAGVVDLSTFLAQGDSGATGDSFQAGTGVHVTVIPEPGTVVLMGLGLAGLGLAGRRS
jgi:hypothetical protein